MTIHPSDNYTACFFASFSRTCRRLIVVPSLTHNGEGGCCENGRCGKDDEETASLTGTALRWRFVGFAGNDSAHAFSATFSPKRALRPEKQKYNQHDKGECGPQRFSS
jgi:hypothetical protein